MVELDNVVTGVPDNTQQTLPDPPDFPVESTVQYSGGERFPQKTEFRDWPFALLFILHVLVLIPILVVAIMAHPVSSTTPVVDPDIDHSIEPSFKPLSWTGFYRLMGGSVFCAAIGLGFSAIWYFLMRTFPREMVYASFILTFLLTLTLGIAIIFLGGFIFGVILVILSLLMPLLLFLLRSRIEFTVILLKVTVDIVNRFKGVLVVSAGGAGAFVSWYFLWLSVVLLWQGSRLPDWVIVIGLVYLFLSLVWTAQVIKNVVHTTIAGTVATWYFQGSSSVTMPVNPTLYSLKRSCTTSFGSICLGSLIVAVLSTLSLLAGVAEKESKNAFVKIVALVAKLILKIFERIIKYLNKYAFTQVAIYGKTYIQAAIDTFRMFSHYGVDAVMNDSLIGNVLVLGSLLGGLICAGVAALVAFIVDPDYFFLTFFLGFFLGYGIVLVALEVIHSASIALFVCFIEQPSVVRDRLPDLYATLQERYHDVCSALFISI